MVETKIDNRYTSSMIINMTKDNEYYSQRNNRVYPHSACMATSYAMASDYAGCQWHSPQGQQPEDHLMRFLRSKRAELYAREHHASLVKKGSPANEIHGVLPWAYKTIGGQGTAIFKTNWTLEQLLFFLLQGSGVVISGRFPHYKKGCIDHVVCLAGFETKQKSIQEVRGAMDIVLDDISSFIIDDPYGDYRNEYRSHKGNNISVKFDDFVKMFKPCHEHYKWAHIISNGE